MVDPGFVFVPTDIGYSIEFKRNDRERRRKLREVQGNASQREFPTASQYKEHQVAQGLIRPDAVGGLYQPIFLKSFMHPICLPFDISPYLNHPRPWNGARAAS